MRNGSFHRRRALLGVGLALGLDFTSGIADAAQAQTGTIRIEVVEAATPIAGATVSAGGRSATTDASGIVTLALPPGPVSVIATKDGYEPVTAQVDVVAGGERVVRLVLTAKPTEQDQAAVVASTRTGLRIEDQAVPVEVLGRNVIEQELLMTPGNIAGVLDEMVGLRVQTTSPELGLTAVRIQGLRGQYTRLLSDGVPLYFDLLDGLAPVQIPSMDLNRIEVLKGGASALFGANVMSGVVNFLSRRPDKERHREFLFSQSARGATDGALWLSSPQTGSWGRTFLVTAHRQNERDVDDDGWSDLPETSRGAVRQRVFWDNGRGRSAAGTAGVTFETRKGGSEIARQKLETREADGALFGQMPLGRHVLAGAGTLYVQSRTRDFSDQREHERRQGATIEIELRGTARRQTWVAGIAADWFAIRSDDPFPGTYYLSTRPAMFFHDDVQVATWLSVSGSARLEHHNVHGFFLSPRGSVRAHRGPWAAGVTAGQSYSGPTARMEETDAAGLARLSIDGLLHAETATHVSANLTHTSRASAVSVTVFHAHIDDPAQIDRATYTLRTAADPVVTRGAEIALTARRAPFVVTGTYAYVQAREGGGRDVALTPRHRAGLVATADGGQRGQIGMHVLFTGEQRLDANPYRSTSEPYVVLDLLAERPFGRWRLFVTARNLTNVRQTHWDPIARPARDVDGRWTVDPWAPLAGRLINFGIRVSF
jgi:outer membrane receptor for ferrienterochelin and colicins